MAKLLSMARFSLRPNLAAALPHRLFLSSSFSFTATLYPLYYELIDYRPTPESLAPRRRRRPPAPPSKPDSSPEESEGPTPPELGFGNWVDRKLSELDRAGSNDPGMDKSKRKYYDKRRKRMYGSDSEGDVDRDSELVELKPEIVKFNSYFEREEEIYFYDAFALPWEKGKHYRMVYQLEKKYFPDQCYDKAFLAPGEYEAANAKANANAKGRKKGDGKKKGGVGDGKKKGGVEDDKAIIFFEGDKDEKGGDAVKDPKGAVKDPKGKVSEKKVANFFKSLRKVPDKDGEVSNGEPNLVTRSSELPPTWDGPFGTVVLVDKPKGWTSFTVCGKLRRLVNVQKVGHAGTLDPMATGLLIVCVGKATKIVDSYQGMIKGYSGVFRLGEATSTWDADSAVIQREPWEHITDVDIKKVAASFCGEIWQVPPMFSAIKVGGEKMYDKARRGQNMELSPRRISIFQFDIERSLDNRQNLIFRVTCSKGTYIRSLCADFGKALGSCAHLTALRRDCIGEYSADDAWDFRKLEEAVTKGYL